MWLIGVSGFMVDSSLIQFSDHQKDIPTCIVKPIVSNVCRVCNFQLVVFNLNNLNCINLNNLPKNCIYSNYHLLLFSLVQMQLLPKERPMILVKMHQIKCSRWLCLVRERQTGPWVEYYILNVVQCEINECLQCQPSRPEKHILYFTPSENEITKRTESEHCWVKTLDMGNLTVWPCSLPCTPLITPI